MYKISVIKPNSSYYFLPGNVFTSLFSFDKCKYVRKTWDKKLCKKQVLVNQ